MNEPEQKTMTPEAPERAMVPVYRLDATRAVLAERERELLALKGPCSSDACRLHYAHSGPCVSSAPATESGQA